MAELQFLTGSTFVSSPVSYQRKMMNLVGLLQVRASQHGDQVALTFLQEDGTDREITYAELDLRARAVAATLQRTIQPGERALLVYPPGVEFVCGFFGSIYAAALPVPATYPKPRRPMPRLNAIARDSAASIALTTSQTLETLDFERMQPDLAGLPWMATDEPPSEAAVDWQRPELGPDPLCYLQYTSGSTSDPKGVMVSHANLMHNLEMIRHGFALRRPSGRYRGVFWLPAYHDMGLIGGILEPLYVGGQSILMPPASFLKRPFRWLEAISRYRANISGAPNFAYELAAKKITAEQRASLDLSCLKLAFCGAEPICPETLERFAETFTASGFSAEAFYPCYGLAEATLIASGSEGPRRPVVKRVLRSALSEDRAVDANGDASQHVQRLVSCGAALLDQEIAIVDPETQRRCAEDQVGEIWIKGPSVARGYWNRQDESQHTFQAHIAGDDATAYLRTGDLGFVSDGHLFITGRIKDVVIIRGRNYYPQDIERTVEAADEALCPGAGTAFSIDVDGRERLVLIHEVDRAHRQVDLEKIIHKIRNAVTVEHELDVYAIALIRQASLPMTTSGKVQRSLCRERFLTGQLRELARWVSGKMIRRGAKSAPQPVAEQDSGSPEPVDTTPDLFTSSHSSTSSSATAAPEQFVRPDRPMTADEIDRLAERIESWMLDWLVEKAAIAAEHIDRNRPFAELGLDSLTAVEMSQQLEDWLHVELTSIVAWNYPTPAALARYLAEQAAGQTAESQQPAQQPQAMRSDQQFDDLLAEIEKLSDSEVEAQLQDRR